MNKIKIIIGIIFAFLIVYLLQANFFSWFNLAGVKPNLFVILVLTIGLFSGRSMGTTFGILFGLCLDFFIGKSVGIYGCMLGIVGIIGGYLDKNFSKDSRITIITMITFVTVIFELGTYLLNVAVNSYQINTIYFIKLLIIELMFNIILTIIIYPLIIKFGYKIEETFKENKILTRYF